MGSIYLGTQRVLLRVQRLIILKKVLLISIFERSFANEYSLFSFFEHFQDHKLMRFPETVLIRAEIEILKR